MRPQAHILTIGNEVLKGTVLNTNARYLGRELTALGFEVVSQSSCRDIRSEIQSALERAFSQSDLVIACGGLGPTPDDVTRDAVAEYFKVPLVFSSRQYRFIQRYYKIRRRRVPSIVRKEALFPKTSRPLFNRFGIALGFTVRRNGKTLAVLPGVPTELEKMFQHEVLPELKKDFPHVDKRYRLIVKTVGLSEPGVMQKLGKSFFREKFDFGIYPHPGEVSLRIYAEKKKIVQALARRCREKLGPSIYAWSERTLSEAVGDNLRRKKLSLAVAESCTGGLLSSLVTQAPGASRYFRGSVTVYQKDLKEMIGVPAEALDRSTVSAKVAQLLAVQIRKYLRAGVGVGITGAAGPEPESGRNPGTVFIAVSAAGARTVCREYQFLGDRNQVQLKAAVKALEIIWRLTC